MNEEVVIQKYTNLNSELYKIKAQLKEVLEDFDDLKLILKDTLLIDNKMVNDELFESLLNTQNETINGLDTSIRRINNKL